MHYAIKIMITSDNIRKLINALHKGHAVSAQGALPFALACTNAPELEQKSCPATNTHFIPPTALYFITSV
jgi:hypothetical protein